MTTRRQSSLRLVALTLGVAWLTVSPGAVLAQGICPSFIAGDCTGDRAVTVADASTVFSHLTGLQPITNPLLFDACNVSGVQGNPLQGGVVDIDDFRVLLGFITGRVDVLSTSSDPAYLYLTHNGSSTLGQWDMAPLAPAPTAPLVWPLVNLAGGPLQGTRRAEVINAPFERRVLVAPFGTSGLYEFDRCFPSGPALTGCNFVTRPGFGGALTPPFVADITHDDFFSNQFHIVSSLINPQPSHYGYGQATRPFGPIAPQPVCQYELQYQQPPQAPPSNYEAAEYQPPARANPFVGDVWVGSTGLLASVDSFNLHDIFLNLPSAQMRVLAIAFDSVPPPSGSVFAGSPGAGYLAGTLPTGAYIARAGKREPHVDPIVIQMMTPLPSVNTTRIDVFDVVIDETPRPLASPPAPAGIGYVAWMTVDSGAATAHLTSFTLDPDPNGTDFAVRGTISLPASRIGGLELIRPAIGSTLLYAYRSEGLGPATVAPNIDILDVSAGLPASLMYSDPSFLLGTVPVAATGPALAFEITRSR